MNEVLAWVAIVFSVVSLAWTTFITVRLNDAHFSITPAPISVVYADGNPAVSLTLSSLGAHLARDVRLAVKSDPMNHSLKLSERSWHGLPAGSAVELTATGIAWFPSSASFNPWNERFYGAGTSVEDRLVTVSWKDTLGFRRRQEIELPRLPSEPDYATMEIRMLVEAARLKNAW